MSDEKIVHDMRETFRIDPDASPMDAVVEADADPDRWLGVAETIAEGGELEVPPEPDEQENSEGDDEHEPEPAEMPAYDGPWGDVEWTLTESGAYPMRLLEREQWMARDGKLPFAPWGDRDAPAECNTTDCPAERADEARCDCDARRKWGYEAFYRDGETVAMAEADPKIDGRAFIQRERDPFSFVDGDDVRDPESGAVHPAFVDILNRFGMTYADVSTSGSGVHANYEGELPNDIPEAKWILDDEPWGTNDDLPAIEIYSNTHVCVTTGEKLPGSAEDVREWDADAVRDVLDEAGELRQTTTDRADFDAEEYEPQATDADETTDEIRDIYHALDRLNAQAVAEDTIVAEWLEQRTENRCFRPTWASSDYDGTAVYCDEDKFVDSGQRGGYGGPAAMAAIDAGLVRDTDCPRGVSGETWFKALAHLRELGYDIPEFVGEQSSTAHEFDVVSDGRDEVAAAEAEAVAGSDEAAEPAETDGGAVASGTDDDAPGRTRFERFRDEVHSAIAAVNDDDDLTQRTARHRMAKAFDQFYDFVYPEDEVRGWRTKLYVYAPEDGIYEPRGEAFVAKQLEKAAGDYVTNQVVNEIVGKLERMSTERGPAFEGAPERLVVGNGILNLHTGELEPFTPTEYHRKKLDIDWNPDAGEPHAIDDFLHDIVADDDVDTLYRLIAHSLYKEYVGEKAAMLIGSGQNGKSVFLDLVEQFLGQYNVSHRSLQAFEDKFAANALEGKLANIHPDMGDSDVTDLSQFKKLTGRDTFQADVKFESPVEFENYATLMFAANEMPVFDEDNHAVWRRWLYLDFPYTFDADDPDAKDPEPKRVLMRRLTADKQLEGLLYRCQQEIERWYDGDPWYPDAMDPSEVREQMKKAAEPVFDFAMTCLIDVEDEDESGVWLPKSDVRQAYREYAAEQQLPTMGKEQFGERLLGLADLNIESGRPTDENGNRPRAYMGVTWSEHGRQLLGLDEPDDEDQSTVGDVASTKARVLEIVRDLVEENDHDPVERSLVVGRAMGSMGMATAEKRVDDLLKSGDLYAPEDGKVIDT